jgi:hypothetical protein
MPAGIELEKQEYNMAKKRASAEDNGMHLSSFYLYRVDK